MWMLFSLCCLRMMIFHCVVTGNILNAYFKNSTGESMFTYYFSAVRIMDTNSLRCLMKCHQKITSCTGINVNTKTGECTCFDLLPIVDQSGNYQTTTRSENWVSHYKYPGK